MCGLRCRTPASRSTRVHQAQNEYEGLLGLEREEPIAHFVDEPDVIGQRREPPEDRVLGEQILVDGVTSSTEIGICLRLLPLPRTVTAPRTGPGTTLPGLRANTR